MRAPSSRTRCWMVAASRRISAMSSAGPFTAVVIGPPLSHLAAGHLLEQTVHVADVIAEQVVGLEHVVDADQLLGDGERELRPRALRWRVGGAPHDDHAETLRAARLTGAAHEPVIVAVAHDGDRVAAVDGA